MWKDFFYYTKSERRVILLLLAIALLLLGIWAIMEYLRPVEVPVTLSESEEIDSFLANLEEQEKYVRVTLQRMKYLPYCNPSIRIPQIPYYYVS